MLPLTGKDKLPMVKLIDSFDASWDYVANDGQNFTLKTNLDAPRYRQVQQQREQLTDLC